MHPSDTVRLVFAGTGGMGQCAHLRNYAALPGCTVTALAELRPRTAAAVAGRYGIPRVYADLAAMLRQEKPDAIVASQPFDRHGLLLPPLLQAGVPVFTEKPLASSLATGERLLQELRACGGRHLLGYHKRSDPATMHLKQEIARLQQTGELGPLKYIRLLMPEGDWIAGGFRELIRADDPASALDRDPPAPDLDAPGFAEYTRFVNYYIHQINLLRHLLGEPYELTYADPTGVLLAAQSASGIPAAIEMTPYRTTLDWQESALVCFAKGYLKLTLPAPLAQNRPGSVEFFRDPGEGAMPQTIVPQLPWKHAMLQQAENFLAAVRGEQTPLCEAEEALDDLRLARSYLRLRFGK